MYIFISFAMILVTLLWVLFCFLGKMSIQNHSNLASFECGFTSYFYSRFSFSIHYFMVALIFLFLDLEICFLIPFFVEDLNSKLLWLYVSIFITVLLCTLFKEWNEGKLEWEF